MGQNINIIIIKLNNKKIKLHKAPYTKTIYKKR